MPRKPPASRGSWKPQPEELARDAIAHEESLPGDKVRMTFRVVLSRAALSRRRKVDARRARDDEVRMLLETALRKLEEGPP